MLAAIGIDARLVWAADREDGSIDMQVPNPAWFDRVLVAAQIDGQRVSSRPRGPPPSFGHLQPGYARAPTHSSTTPGSRRSSRCPETPFDQNVRRALRLELTADAAEPCRRPWAR